jgi:hypothetical protein
MYIYLLGNLKNPYGVRFVCFSKTASAARHQRTGTYCDSYFIDKTNIVTVGYATVLYPRMRPVMMYLFFFFLYPTGIPNKRTVSSVDAENYDFGVILVVAKNRLYNHGCRPGPCVQCEGE